MAEVTLAQRFHGTCNLAILHLRRAAKSNDLEAGFSAARDLGMLKPDQEEFVRRCLALDAKLEAREDADEPPTEELIRKLQSCILSLNTADPA